MDAGRQDSPEFFFLTIFGGKLVSFYIGIVFIYYFLYFIDEFYTSIFIETYLVKIRLARYVVCAKLF